MGHFKFSVKKAKESKEPNRHSLCHKKKRVVFWSLEISR